MKPQFKSSNDSYETPNEAINDLLSLIDLKKKVIYEPFYASGASGDYLKSLGYKVIHEPVDYFTNNFNYDCILSNPPFSIKRKIFEKLLVDQKPFILLMPLDVMCSKMYKPFVRESSFIIPSSRVNYKINGRNLKTACPFNSIWYVWKFNLSRKLVFL